jgi:hyperosmotically inducible periplasmic protein
MNQAMSDLRNQVQAVFLQDESLHEYGIEVLDSNGVITLRGVVPTRDARERAEAIARQVEGVTSVINEIDVV